MVVMEVQEYNMGTIPIELIVWVTASAVIFGLLYWAFKPNKCPVCGETMDDEYVFGKGIVSRSCPKCCYNEEIEEL